MSDSPTPDLSPEHPGGAYSSDTGDLPGGAGGERTGAYHPIPHPGYRRPAGDAGLAGHCGGTSTGPAHLLRQGPPGLPVRTPGASTSRPRPGRPQQVCGRCDAPTPCCHCGADIGRLRRFATRMAMIHQPTGTAVCGCGTHNCYVRTRLDAIRWQPWR